MKKIFRLLLCLSLLMLSAPAAMAATDQTTVQEGANFIGINRLAIMMPNYVPAEKGDLTKEELVDVIYKPHKDTKFQVLSYDEAVREILAASNINIKTLERHKAAQIFVENAPKFCDAYIVLTVANNKGIDCFFDVQRAGTNELLYTYHVASGSTERGKDLDVVYRMLAEKFYSNLNETIQDQQKKALKK